MTATAERQETGAPAPVVEARPASRLRYGLYALAALPVLSMVVEVLWAPKLQFLDYWFILLRVANPDGSLQPRGILTYQNEHPMFVPGLLFWLDARFLGGSNRTLGLLSVAFVVLTVVLLARLLPRTMGTATRALLTTAFAVLLLSPHGLHNFAYGMSGVGWLSANLAAVAALHAAHRRRIGLAVLLGLLGCACYGTAFAVWPALAVLLWLRRSRRWLVALPLVIGVAVVATWVLTVDGLQEGTDTAARGPEGLLASLLGTTGSLWTSNARELAVLAGAVIAAGLLWFAAEAARTRLAAREGDEAEDPAPERAAWVALAVYALGAITMIGLARSEHGLETSLTSRYASLPGLACVALIGLAACHPALARRAALPVVALTAALATFALSADGALDVRNQYPRQGVIATAMLVGAEGSVGDLRFPADAVPRARGLGMYPYTSDFTLGCGGPGYAGPELGDRVDLRSAASLPGPPGRRGDAAHIDEVRENAGWRFSGWALVGGSRPDCVLLVDDRGIVVGGGGVGIRRADLVTKINARDTSSGWLAVAGPSDEQPIVLVVRDGVVHRVDSGAEPPAGG